MPIANKLLELQRITPDQLRLAQKQQQDEQPTIALEKVLLNQEVISEWDLLEALGSLYHVDVIPTVSDDMLDAKLIHDLPVDWALSHVMLPVMRDDERCVLLPNLSRLDDQADLGMLLHCDLTPLLTTTAEIERCIQRCYYKQKETASEFIKELAETTQGEKIAARNEDSSDLLKRVESAPVTRLVNIILLEAVKHGASDIHIESYAGRTCIRYRVDGLLHEQTSPPKEMEAALISRLKVMGHLDIAEKRLPQDGMTKVRIGDREMDVRISTIPVASGERVVLRLLNTENLVRPLADLGMPPYVADRFQILLNETRGAIWVTGPTGSGKTTTLYAALQALDTIHRNVLTIEDPIEYRMDNIGQMAVKPKIGLTFSQGLRHLLRQDPDVILIGETRDLETAEIAIRASLTGHLVFSTLHTNDAVGAIVRLVDMGIPPYLISEATKGVLAQRLVRSLCPICKTVQPILTADKAALGVWSNQLDNHKTYEGVGCDQCYEGYSGRIGMYELLVMDQTLRAIVRDQANPNALNSHVAQREEPSMMDDAISKIKAGKTSVSEILRVVGRL